MLNFKLEDLDDSDFTGIDAPDSMFDSCSMVGCSFEGNFDESKINNSDLAKSTFQYCSLANLTLKEVRLLEASFETSDLTGTSFSSVAFDTKFSNCGLEGLRFDNPTGYVRLSEGSSLEGAEFVGSTDLVVFSEGSEIKTTSFSEHNRVIIEVTGGSVNDVKSEGGVFRGSFLEGAQVENVVVSRSNLVRFHAGPAIDLKMVRIDYTKTAEVTLFDSTISDISFFKCSRLNLSMTGDASVVFIGDSDVDLSSVGSKIFDVQIEQSTVGGSLRRSVWTDLVCLHSSFTKFNALSSTFANALFQALRIKKSTFRSDFKDADYVEVDIENCDYSRCTHGGSSFVSCAISSTLLEEAKFSDVQFTKVRLTKCNFAKATFIKCSFDSTYFVDCDLSQTTFIGCIFLEGRTKVFDRSDTSKAKFS